MRVAVGILCLGFLCGSVHAQTASDMIDLFGGIVRSGVAAATQSAWERLPPAEISCVDRTLREHGSSINLAIQQGIGPSDARIVGERASCRGVAQTPSALTAQSTLTNYTIDGLTLGAKVLPGSASYQKYGCAPSEQFEGFTFCKKISEEREARGAFASTNTILHSDDGTIAYVNRYLEPAFFAPGEAEADIERLTKKYGSPQILRIPSQAFAPFGMIVSWGAISLQPIEPNLVSELAAGRDIRAGFLIDHIGNFHRSAQLGLPIYRLGGGPGFVWAAAWGTNQKGTLRFLAANPSFYDRATAVRIAAEREVARAAEAKAEAERISTERALAARTAADRAAADRMEAERAAAEKAAADRAAAERMAADRAAAEKAAAERAAADKAAAEKAKADEAMRRAEQELALQKEAREKGTEYALASGTVWNVIRRKNEMTDRIDTSVKSIQKSEGVTVEIIGDCQNGAVSFSGLVVDSDGNGLNVPGQTGDIKGAPVLYRINDAPPANRIVPALEFSNKFELVRLSNKTKAETVEDVYRSVGAAMGVGATLSPSYTWRVMVQFKTTGGSIIVKLPMFGGPIQELITSCVQ
jgi:hypothetical protein